MLYTLYGCEYIYLYYGHQAKVDPLLEFLTVSAESRERGKGGETRGKYCSECKNR
jgi:hypothetical protein